MTEQVNSETFRSGKQSAGRSSAALRRVDDAMIDVHRAHHDELTGLANRNLLNLRLTHAMSYAQRRSATLAVLCVDLDGFKTINDGAGREVGDRVLKAIAERMRAGLRECDTVARVGGDEFVVLLEDIPESLQLVAVAQKMLDALARPFTVDAREFSLTASIGISVYPSDAVDAGTLLENADTAMCQAKVRGKNTYQFYSARLHAESTERVRAQSTLRRALDDDELELHYQPRIHMASGAVVGMEALIRWRQAGEEPMPPTQFLPLAEKTGLIVPIGEWVLRRACTQGQAWLQQGLPPMSIAVDLSARQFTQDLLLHAVKRILRETALDPVCLQLDITEQTALHDPERTVKLLRQLKALGVQLSLAGFGTGYSSLKYISVFPVDSLKIDPSFVQNLPQAEGASITQAIIATAHALGRKVIATGVETREQFDVLCEYQCDEMQGHYFSTPLSAQRATALLQQMEVASN